MSKFCILHRDIDRNRSKFLCNIFDSHHLYTLCTQISSNYQAPGIAQKKQAAKFHRKRTQKKTLYIAKLINFYFGF